MWKVTILNLINDSVFGQEFNSEEIANAWLLENISKNTWGHPARSLYEVPEELQSLIISQEEILQADEVTFRTLYHLKAEYEITGPIEVLLSDNTDDARDLRLKDAINKAMMWDKYYNAGAMVKKYFTFLINTRPITSAQKNAIQAMPEIIAIDEQLKFGRLLQAKALAQALVADEALIFQADIDAVCLFIDDMVATI
jgi:hypothetical protein